MARFRIKLTSIKQRLKKKTKGNAKKVRTRKKRK